MGQTPSVPTESFRLIFENNSIRDSTLKCAARGIHYRLSTMTDSAKPAHITTISRWDQHENMYIPIAIYRRNTSIGKDEVKITEKFAGDSGGYRWGADKEGFVPLERFLKRTSGLAGSINV